ncbi:TPA: hypothetical protein ACSP3E_004122, partial [Aeromonas veronii]
SNQPKASNLVAHFKRCGLQQPHQPNPGQNQDQIAHFLATKPHHKHQKMGINSPCTASNQLKAPNLVAHFKRYAVQQPHEPNPGRNQEQIARLLTTKPHHKHQEMGINSPCTASNQLKAPNQIAHFNRSQVQQPRNSPPIDK